jgi:hypothetical protein
MLDLGSPRCTMRIIMADIEVLKDDSYVFPRRSCGSVRELLSNAN